MTIGKISVIGLIALALPAQQKVDKAVLDRWMQELSNWGRWGKTDQMGTLTVSQTASFSEALRLFQSGAGRVVLTAASADQLSYESDRLGHGYFTHFLLKALQESSGRATIVQLYQTVKSATETTV